MDDSIYRLHREGRLRKGTQAPPPPLDLPTADDLIESEAEVPLTEDQRHHAFKVAQGFAYRYALKSEAATNTTERDFHRVQSQMWAQVTQALRRDHM